ncbi:hypothetical protein FF38_12382 [Lucilia cuprina]|uniref:Uncharacterized protein n=1 Tax=Lucilia cuprina TaxID=7375 RepID=A0A0L0BW69_LUCCU|nr:hypothetical protein FF38_12382 [Lucilia cuprina]
MNPYCCVLHRSCIKEYPFTRKCISDQDCCPSTSSLSILSKRQVSPNVQLMTWSKAMFGHKQDISIISIPSKATDLSSSFLSPRYSRANPPILPRQSNNPPPKKRLQSLLTVLNCDIAFVRLGSMPVVALSNEEEIPREEFVGMPEAAAEAYENPGLTAPPIAV